MIASTGRIVRLVGGVVALMISSALWAGTTVSRGMLNDASIRPPTALPLVVAASDAEVPANLNSLFDNDPDDGVADVVAPSASSGRDGQAGVPGARGGASPSNLKGFAQFEFARTVDAPVHWTKMLTRIELGSQGRLGDDMKWKLSARLDADPVYSQTDFYPPEVKQDQKLNLSLRENYLDFSAGGWDFRLGRQHVIWGEMVGLFFADVVSARDMREFILPQYDVLRIPQWATRAEYFGDDFHAELLWIPIPSYDESGKPGSAFFPVQPVLPGFAIQYRDEVTPSRELNHTNYGMRLSSMKDGWDLSGFYYRSMDVSPTFYRQEVSGPAPTVIYEARHDRIQQAGGTLSKDFGSVVLKGEAVYTQGRRYTVLRLSEATGVVPQNTLDWVLGLDFALPAEARLNLQLFQSMITKHDPDVLPAKYENGYSLLLHGNLAPRLDAEVLWISSLNRNDWLLRPQLIWNFEKNWRLTAGADTFSGPPLGMFGRYNLQDRVYTELRYSF